MSEELKADNPDNESGWDFEDEEFEEAPEDLNPVEGAKEGPKQAPSDAPKNTEEASGWGVWGMSSLLSTATGTVSTFTSQVTSGLTTVLGSTLAVSEVLSSPTKESSKMEESTEEVHGPEVPFGLGNILGGVSSLGSKVLAGGLDTLETLGKKTMEVLQEGDPGLKKKRAFLFDTKGDTLSQILREAKDKAETEFKQSTEIEPLRKVHFETLFDDYQGLVHLEALEMVSKQCELKLQSILSECEEDAVQDLQETLEQVKELCEFPPDEEPKLSHQDFTKNFEEALQILATPVATEKLRDLSVSMLEITKNWSGASPSIIHREAIKSLAQLAALSMEFLHRVSEILMVREHRSTANESESLLNITLALCGRIAFISDEFVTLIPPEDRENHALITNIYLESSNSTSYLRNAFNLLIPVIQLGAVSS